MVRSFALIAFACIAACAGVANAEPDTMDGRSPVHVRLAVKPGDLSTPQGVQKFYRRIEDVADRACTNDDDAGLAVPAQDRDCVRQAVSNTVRNLKIPELSRLDDRQRGQATTDVALADEARRGQ